MKFNYFLSENRVPEWASYYINFRRLKLLIKPFKIAWKIYGNQEIEDKSILDDLSNDLENQEMANIPENILKMLDNYKIRIVDLMNSECGKIDDFFKKHYQKMFSKFCEFKLNSLVLRKYKENDLKGKKTAMKNASIIYYKELIYFIEFFPLNYEGFRKVIKKQNKIGGKISKSRFSINLKVGDYFANSFIQNNYLNLQKLKQDFEKLYLDNFYENDKRDEGRKELTRISQGKELSGWGNYFFGFFSGSSFVFFLIFIFLSFYYGLDSERSDYYNALFPMYRGALLLVLYLWLLPFNVYIWTHCHINYKLIFKFNHHFSKYEEILKRSASFTTLFFVSFILFMQSMHFDKTQKGIITLEKQFDESFREDYPLIFWGVLSFYLFFPSIKVFNGEGRKYMFSIFKKILFYSFFYVDFVIVWATDQFASFVILMQDLHYTTCFYINNFFISNTFHESFETCSSRGLQLEAFLLSSLPLFLRMIQCTTSNFKKPNGFSFLNSDFLNFLKYLFSFVTALMGYIYYLHRDMTFLILWICLAMLSTIYSYIWDLKQDWGFLAKNTEYRFLRAQLSYPKISWYYLAITLNFILRLSWTISLSTVAFEFTQRKEIIMLIVGLLEMLRRVIWNFFRVEKEHIINCGMFKAVEEYELPFDDVIKNKHFREEEYLKQPETTSSSFKPIELDNDDLTASLIRHENFNISYHIHSIENGMGIDFKKIKHVNSNPSLSKPSKIFQLDEKLDSLKDLIEEISRFENNLKEEKMRKIPIVSEKSDASIVTFQYDKNHRFEREMSLEKQPLNLYEKSFSLNYFRQGFPQEICIQTNEKIKKSIYE